MDSKRFGIQAAAALIQNANFKGFFTGKIYTGQTKGICVPGLNCYSCPGAAGACPIGSLQSFLTSRPVRFPYYVAGLLIFFGAVLGRAVCGFLCPVGLLQELINKIPFPLKKNKFKGDKQLRYLKYAVLFLMLVLPLFIALTPFFCKYVCPAGTLAGIILASIDSKIRPLLGAVFSWKVFVLAALIVLSLIIWRPFCKYLCPLGAIYGFFNRISIYGNRLDKDKCVGCGKCADVCRMCVDPSKSPNSSECVRCGDCVRACPTGALQAGFRIRPEKSGNVVNTGT